MGDKIRFVSNYNDLSTRQGFQFEFICDRCGTGYRTSFKPSSTGAITEVLDTAGSFFGGIFGRTADVSNRIHSVTWEKAHDQAFKAAVEEVIPDFVQCPRCSSWVCREKCWNTQRGLCKHCAPDLGVEMSAAQASHSVSEVWAHACMADEDKKLSQENWKEVIKAACPKCEAPLSSNMKFCPDCGEKLHDYKYCGACGAQMPFSHKFCPECGQKI